MEKAYSLKGLGKKMQSKGLPVLETAAEQAYIAFKEWIVESAVMSENKLDDMGIPLIKFLDQVVVPVINKIDGDDAV